MTNESPCCFLDRPGQPRLAYVKHAGEAGRATLVWLGGFRSDMEGGKALALDAWAEETGQPFLRFDYSGHGRSEGAFEDGGIGQWREDALAMIDSTEGPLVLCGSSMGGWIALLVALARPKRVKALLLIAPAPDFTEDLMWEGMPQHVREAVMRDGVWMQPSEYGPSPITRKLIEEGRNWLLLDGPIPFSGPVRILQGWRDRDVPWTHAARLLERIDSDDLVFTLVKNGDHRLSEPEDLDSLRETAEALCALVDKGS